MTTNENLLLVAMEEASEVQKAISKLMRFGDGAQHNNSVHVMEEFCELEAMIMLCKDHGLLPHLGTQRRSDIIQDKVKRVNEYMELSKKFGIVRDE